MAPHHSNNFSWLTVAGFSAAAMWGVAVPCEQFVDGLRSQPPPGDDELVAQLTANLDAGLAHILTGAPLRRPRGEDGHHGTG